MRVCAPEERKDKMTKVWVEKQRQGRGVMLKTKQAICQLSLCLGQERCL